MAGGIMNIVAKGQQNILLTGNPSKTFFKTSFAQHTNFGIQKFRLDFEGSKTLKLTEPSVFTFKVSRYADLLMDTYVSIDMPNIWSPILPPQKIPNTNTMTPWAPYEAKWIDNLGAKMITKVSISSGNYTLQEYSGDYLLACMQRDFSAEKKELFSEMIGHVPEMYDPANSNGRSNVYPNAYYTENSLGAAPSINARTLMIPLNSWFGIKSQMAFPLVALQYNELTITLTFRPISELLRIRDVLDYENGFPYIAPNFNELSQQFYRFLYPPPSTSLALADYTDKRFLWNTNLHLNCTYAFLSEDEQRTFALKEQSYPIRQIRETKFHDVTGTTKSRLDSNGMVTGYMFYLQRSDVNLRNEWSNYTNWPYSHLPYNLIPAHIIEGGSLGPSPDFDATVDISDLEITFKGDTYSNIGPGINPDNQLTGSFITNVYTPENIKNILVSMGILLDGSYRENTQPAGVYNYVEKYTRTSGNAPNGLYCYNYSLNSNASDLQPSGALNMSKFNLIEFEIETIVPPRDPNAQTLVICDPDTGEVIGVNKATWRIYDYNFDLIVFEERINFITFTGGNTGLLFSN